MTSDGKQRSFTVHRTVAMAVDPIHVGTGGSRLGRVDNSIVRDPVTRIPKIPGSSLAGVHRAYAAMALEDKRAGQGYQDPRDDKHKDDPFYPNCAGQGQTKGQEHCGDRACPICSAFGHASFAGLAAFSDAQVLLFPVPTREGPVWVTSPGALRFVGFETTAEENVVYREKGESLNLGWLLLPRAEWPTVEIVEKHDGTSSEGSHATEDAEPPGNDEGRDENLQNLKNAFRMLGIPMHILDSLALVSDKLFSHVVNSNLEVRTSVAINPETGAAEDGALFTYEALPRATVLVWDVTCRDPRHFVDRPQAVDPHDTVTKAHPLLEALGIGGMGTRGMGRLRVLKAACTDDKAVKSDGEPDERDQTNPNGAREEGQP